MTKLNDIKETLSDVAKVCGIMGNELSIDYSLNLDEELYSELEKLANMSLVLKKALDEKDMVAVQAALVMSRIYSMNLRNFFNDIYDDIELIGWTERYSWPEIPEGYQIPEHYKHPNK
ncbi:hypothetical protein OP862_00725 [Yersinia massiliensis]|uniref:Uncharacterized protein n=1 Tax=Yersinia massiliensis TaxID=419257 RepID=A0AA90Y085_9GAMM|nr:MULTISPECIES: hypothetical protein [Yersinia]MDA5547902.1 hypothetical protein [Yersinia massiliensis]NIL27948.1 hypothetical protein [Yersinia massiliensis]UZM79254.1 hypothetical protein OP862_00725 [Yersinia massiliensis]CNG74230.1 Uncharacterised protein [Yersinia frederiksenii]CQJ05206.1 Uncharacterised protein [Yersinia frederiksenii]